MRAVVSSLEPSDAQKLLENLVRLWQSRFVLSFLYLHSLPSNIYMQINS